MVEEQNAWANRAYKGESPWERQAFDEGHPPAVNMQIEFDLKHVQFVKDEMCAKHAFTQTHLIHKYNPYPEKYFTFVVITDDQSGVLGQTEFPQDWSEDSKEQMI